MTTEIPTSLTDKVVNRHRLLFWRWMAFLLFLSNFVVGSLAVHFLRSNDRAYAQMVERRIPIIDGLGTVATAFSTVQRRHLHLLVGSDSETLRFLQKDCQIALDEADIKLKEVIHLLGENNMTGDASDLLSQVNRYKVCLDGLRKLPVATVNDRAEAADYVRVTIRPILDNFILTCDVIKGRLQNDALAESTRISDINSDRKHLFMGLAGWPLFFAAVTIIFFLLFMVWLVFLSQRIRLGDQE